MKRIYKTAFHAIHYIKGHSHCGKRHSHQYRLKVMIEFNHNEWVDFHIIRERVTKALADTGIVDHTENYLGHMDCESLANLIHNNIFMETKDIGVKEIKLELYETDHFGVEFP